MHTKNVGPVADEILAAIDGASQIATFTARDPSFRIEHAYATLAELRKKRTARGERQVGRKIGFTNRGIWEEYKVYAPIWGDMFDTTVSELSASPAVQVSRFSEPRIEPEIVFKLSKDVRAGIDEAGLLDSIEWVTHGFEIVQSIFPGWKFTGVDCFAAEGLHGALLLGPPRSVASLGPNAMEALANFSVTLSCDGKVMDRGRGANVLDSPLSALRHLVDVLDMDPFNPPLRAGEIITTGTLTRAFPVAAGETWSTQIEGIALEGVTVRFT
ncbi:MAG: fumarylacetoacetate hydrolase family protein [Pseudorhodoplanes sp.]|nr:fumarylacetoacetate hydrolase family protein [Pseudorhodoplanes sp.]